MPQDLEDLSQPFNGREGNYSGRDFSGRDLSNADFRCANLSGTIFVGTNLSGANLEGAFLSGAIIEGANLEGTNLKQTIFERIYQNKVIEHRIVINYSDGINSSELMSLPALIDILKDMQPGAMLALEKVQSLPDGSYQVVISVRNVSNDQLAELQKASKKLQVAQKQLLNVKAENEELKNRLKQILYDQEMSKPALNPISAGSKHLHVLFADVTGFTSLEGEPRSAMLAMLRAIARPLVETQQGRLINMEGDCVIAAFADINDALGAAFNLTAHLAIEGTSSHAAIASGLVAVKNNPSLGSLDIEGDSVNFAARLLSMAEEGEVLAAEDSAYDPNFNEDFFAIKPLSRPLKKAMGDKPKGTEIECARITDRRNNCAAFR